LCDSEIALAVCEDLSNFSKLGQPVSRTLEVKHILDPVQKLRKLNFVGHLKYGLLGVLSPEGIAQIEGLRREEHLHQTHEDFTVVFVVDPPYRLYIRIVLNASQGIWLISMSKFGLFFEPKYDIIN
jgi:hypothetical protein